MTCLASGCISNWVANAGTGRGDDGHLAIILMIESERSSLFLCDVSTHLSHARVARRSSTSTQATSKRERERREDDRTTGGRCITQRRIRSYKSLSRVLQPTAQPALSVRLGLDHIPLCRHIKKSPCPPPNRGRSAFKTSSISRRNMVTATSRGPRLRTHRTDPSADG